MASESFEYRTKYVEILIDNGQYTEYDHKLGKVTEQRAATADEVEAFSE